MSEFNVHVYKLSIGRYLVCYIDPLSGKRVRNKFKTQAAAQERKKDLELKYKVRGLAGLASTPVAQLMELHIRKCPYSGIRERKNSFLAFCNVFGHRKISEVGKVELHAWLTKYQDERKLSDRTMLRIRTQINYFFRFLKDEGVVPASPLDEIKFKRNPPMVRPRVVLSVEEVKQVLENAKRFSPDYLYPFLYAIANTGARRSEIIKLTRENVDFNTGLMHLRRTKNGKDRSIRMSQTFTALIQEQFARHNSEYVFPTPEGEMIGRSKLKRIMDKFHRHFPLEKEWGLHALRHSFSYNYLKKGGEMYQLQAILGHRHIQTTVDLYGQLQAQDVENFSPYED